MGSLPSKFARSSATPKMEAPPAAPQDRDNPANGVGEEKPSRDVMEMNEPSTPQAAKEAIEVAMGPMLDSMISKTSETGKEKTTVKKRFAGLKLGFLRKDKKVKDVKQNNGKATSSKNETENKEEGAPTENRQGVIHPTIKEEVKSEEVENKKEAGPGSEGVAATTTTASPEKAKGRKPIGSRGSPKTAAPAAPPPKAEKTAMAPVAQAENLV